MVQFSVRIDFFRDLDEDHPDPAKGNYVGSAIREGMHAAVLPRVGEYVHDLGPYAARNGLFGGDPYSVVRSVEHFPEPAWKVDPAKPVAVPDEAPAVRLVIWADWPGDSSLTGEPPSPGERMLRGYDEQGGWQLWFFSDHAPIEPFPGQPLMRSREP